MTQKRARLLLAFAVVTTGAAFAFTSEDANDMDMRAACADVPLIMDGTEISLTEKQKAYCKEVAAEIKTDMYEEMQSPLYSAILYLTARGFTKEDIVKLDTDVLVVAGIIDDEQLTDPDKINVVKKGFTESRPADPAELAANAKGYTAEELGMPTDFMTQRWAGFQNGHHYPECKFRPGSMIEHLYFL